MAKQSGLGDNFLLGGFNLTGDTQSLGRVSNPRAIADMTGIDKTAYERQHLLKDGAIEWTSFFNDAASAAHPTLKAVSSADTIVSYLRGTALGSAMASMVGKQIDYAPTRPADGTLTIAVSAMANGYGLEWGQQLTPGLKTDTSATNGTGVDTTASAAFGAQAYLHITAFTGTNVQIRVEDSADNVTFAAVTGLTFTTATGVGSERLATANTATIRRYLRVATFGGTFSSVTFAVSVVKNEVAGTVF